MKTSTQVTVTPLILEALTNAVEIMKWHLNNSSLIEGSKKDDTVGEVCRGALANAAAHRAIIKNFVANANEQLNP